MVGRRLHYFGGFKADRDTTAADHWSLALDGGKKWKREADLPDPRGHVAVAWSHWRRERNQRAAASHRKRRVADLRRRRPPSRARQPAL